MAKNLSVLAASIETNAAAVATAMAGGTTTAEATAIGKLLTVLSKRPGDLIPPLELVTTANAKEILIG